MHGTNVKTIRNVKPAVYAVSAGSYMVHTVFMPTKACKYTL